MIFSSSLLFNESMGLSSSVMVLTIMIMSIYSQYFMSILLSLEALMLLFLILSLTYFNYQANSVIFFCYFISFLVLDSVMGLGILTSMARIFGSQKLTFLWFKLKKL